MKLLAVALLLTGTAQAAPADAAPVITDLDTRAWWALTSELSSDAMEGRDTGSPGYARAADVVEARFRAAGLKPGGEGGTYRQSVPLHEVKVEPAGTRFTVTDGDTETPLRFLRDISIRASARLPAAIDAPLVFRGYCGADVVGEVRGKVVVCFGGRRAGLPSASDRAAAVIAGGGIGLIAVDDPGFTVEPARWPDAYARTVTFRGEASFGALAVMRLNAAALTSMIARSGHDAALILAAGAVSKPLANFDTRAQFHATIATTTRDYTSDNVLALLPGTDPVAGRETIVVSAHLDGYGFGEPVDGDALYNGAFDDAAYVATLVRLADRRAGRGLKRGVLFAAFTGEEKGLLGATWFTRHPTVARADLAADINLDQLRPLFPLNILTMHAIDDTTLGTTAKAVAAAMGIAVRPDREPERNLVSRADHWPFLKIGVPATGFVFGYDPGTEAERRYREWYQVRYHRPQDDLTQPWDVKAAADFNRFFYTLTETVADAPARPEFVAGSAYAPK